jgi:hypothetical protein
MANGSSSLDAGIRLVLEELRELKREANEDRRRSDEYWKKADEDRRKADEDRKRLDQRLVRMETRQDKTFEALLGILHKHTVLLAHLVKTADEHTGILTDIRNSLRRNGHGRNGNGKSAR